METIQKFSALGLADPLQRALTEKSYDEPTPIQAQAIPPLLEGHDLLGSAQTGTGKTAAFTLPILNQMIENPGRLSPNQFRALVLTPTRELAAQVAQSFREYGKFSRISTTAIYGGVPAGPQIRALRRGVDVLIATPGRLFDLFGQGHLDFGSVEFFVLDEADRMLDMGFIHDIRKVVKELPKQRQSIFFSATYSSTVEGLASTILSNPTEVRIAPDKTTAESVDHRLCLLKQDNKRDLLSSLIDEQKGKEGRNLTLVFSRTKHGAERLAKHIDRSGVRTEAIHGDKSQRARQRALENFRRGKTPVLVATDVAARGIDVKDITLVINFDLPNDPEAYVHRIGRTARGGAEGCAFSFCSAEEIGELRAIERLIKTQITIHRDHEFHEEKLIGLRAPKGKSSSRGKKRNGKPMRQSRDNHRPQKRKFRQYKKQAV
ncbi:MAG: DEAD/DEAH box helicase [Verrucomicrobiota bacterium]